MTGSGRTVIKARLQQLSDMVTVRHPSVIRNRPCIDMKCSHLCLLSDGIARCACPFGMSLSPDAVTCHEIIRPRPLECQQNEFKCKSEAKCILTVFKCDGYPECSDSSDEDGCSYSKCEAWQFACRSSKQCLLLSQRCDGKPQCSDSSDEADCPPCIDPDTFRCADEKRCVHRSRICDGRWDCSNGQDERNCTASLQAVGSNTSASNTRPVLIGLTSVCGMALVAVVIVVYVCWRRERGKRCKMAKSNKPMSQTLVKTLAMSSHSGVNSVSGFGRSSFYERVTGASSSSSATAASSVSYPPETLNPWPSPMPTEQCSMVTSWQHHRPSHTLSPCSTDVCYRGDESESSHWLYDGGGVGECTTEFRYETDPLCPPPPTPCSRYLSADEPATSCCLSSAASTEPSCYSAGCYRPGPNVTRAVTPEAAYIL